MKKFTLTTSASASPSSYDVIIGDGLLKKAGEYISELSFLDSSSPIKIAVISDSTVGELYYTALGESLAASGFDVYKILFPAGEHSKTISNFSNILESLADLGFTRRDMILALGGGVVTDIAGFVAGAYLRGIPYGIIPTTFQSAINTSIGGRSCVNLLKGKNLVGIVWQPSIVLCDKEILIPSSPNENAVDLMDGLVEALKYAVISDKGLLDSISKRDYGYMLERCISIKKSLVEADEGGKGLSQLLDFGRTLGRGVEKLSSYNISHVQALAKGMLIESAGAFALGFSQTDISKELCEILSSLGFDTSLDYDPEELCHLALLDEKVSGDKISFPIVESFGKATLKKIPLSQLKAIIEAGVSTS